MPVIVSRRCAVCGRRWRDRSARFCGRCGAALAAGGVPGTGTSAAGRATGTPRQVGALRRAVAGRSARGVALIAGTLVVGLTAVTALVVAVGPLPTAWSPAGGDREAADADQAAMEGADVVDGLPSPEVQRGPLGGCQGCDGWQLELTATVTSLEVAADDVLVGTAGGEVLAIDARSGTTRWRTRLGRDAVHAVPVGSEVIVGTAGARVVSLDAASGAVVWDVTVPGPTGGARAVAADDDAVLLLAGAPRDRRAIAVDAHSGELRWVAAVPGRWVGIDDTLVVTVDGWLEGWGTHAPDPRWRTPLSSGEELVGRAGDLVVTRAGDRPRFRHPRTGEVVATAASSVTWWAAAGDGTLVLADTAGETSVIALEPDGSERWRTRLPGPEPVVDRGAELATASNAATGEPAEIDPRDDDRPSRLATSPGCCVEVAPSAGRVLAVDRRQAGRAFLLDLDSGAVLADVGRAAAAVPGMLLIGASGEHGILQGAGEVIGVDLVDGTERWRTEHASVVVGLDPLVVGGRTRVLGPWSPQR
jgi:outer membrane protein assembly factor BamB